MSEANPYVLIVGQGIAGTCLSYIFWKNGIKHQVMDDNDPFAASRAAAGIINPITGRRYVKTWMADEIIPFAEEFYRSMEMDIESSFFHAKSILRIFSTIEEENNWLARTGDPSYKKYMIEPANPENYKQHLQDHKGLGEFKGFQLDVIRLLQDYRMFLIGKNMFLNEKFDIDNNNTYKQFSHIVFAEGYRVIHNPLFNFLPFDPATGEVLIVRIHGLKTNKLLKKKIFIVPLKNDLFWIGSTYDFNMKQLGHKQEKIDQLIQALQNTINSDFEVVEQKIGVRPAVKDRRPLMGAHPERHKFYLFNGMGTKGSSLAPFWANKFYEYLLNGEPLDPQVDLKRYIHFYPTHS